MFVLGVINWEFVIDIHAPTPVFLPGESHGRSSVAGYSPWVTKSQTRLSDFTFTFKSLQLRPTI